MFFTPRNMQIPGLIWWNLELNCWVQVSKCTACNGHSEFERVVDKVLKLPAILIVIEAYLYPRS